MQFICRLTIFNLNLFSIDHSIIEEKKLQYYFTVLKKTYTIIAKKTNTLFNNYYTYYNSCYIYSNLGNKNGMIFSENRAIGANSYEITRLYNREIS